MLAQVAANVFWKPYIPLMPELLNQKLDISAWPFWCHETFLLPLLQLVELTGISEVTLLAMVSSFQSQAYRNSHPRGKYNPLQEHYFYRLIVALGLNGEWFIQLCFHGNSGNHQPLSK